MTKTKHSIEKLTLSKHAFWRIAETMVLSERQKEELNRAILDYLLGNGYPQVCRGRTWCSAAGLILI